MRDEAKETLSTSDKAVVFITWVCALGIAGIVGALIIMAVRLALTIDVCH